MNGRLFLGSLNCCTQARVCVCVWVVQCVVGGFVCAGCKKSVSWHDKKYRVDDWITATTAIPDEPNAKIIMHKRNSMYSSSDLLNYVVNILIDVDCCAYLC